MSTAYRNRYLKTLGLALLAFTLANAALAVQVERYTLDETVREAAAIFVGRAVTHQTRWGDGSQRWMVTDYTFQVDDLVLPGGNIQAGSTVTLSFWGGTIGQETQGIGGFHLPVDGNRYVLMLRQDWDTSGFTPYVAFDNGLFNVVEKSPGGEAIVTDADRQPLVQLSTGRIERADPRPGAQPGESGVRLEAFVAYLRANMARIKALPARQAAQVDPNDPNIMPIVAKAASTDPVGAGDIERADVDVPSSADASGVISIPEAPEHSALDTAIAPQNGIEPQWIRFSRWGSVPIVVNSFVDSFTPWFPEDQYQMSKWNYYADIFRVRVPRTGTYGWPNSRNDLAGWPSSADLQSVYGSPWDANTLGITFWRTVSGLLVEADIALNPAFGWTLNDEAVYLNTTTAWPFRATMLHEMGHMWGLDHQFNFLSIMDYAPKVFRAYGLPFMDDAEAVRVAYPGVAQNRTDLGTYMFRSVGFQNWAQANFPGTVVAGNSFSVTQFQIENVGTTTIASPTLEFYLTTALNYNAGNPYYFLGTQSWSPPLTRFNYYNPASVGATFVVPTSIPGGDYHVASFIRGDAGASQAGFPFSNNFGFTRTKIRVVPRVVSLTLFPQSVQGGNPSTGRVNLGSSAGPGGLTVFLSSSNPSIASVPGSVFIPAGSSFATFTVNTVAVAVTTNVLITASSNGVSESATLTVLERPSFSLTAIPSSQSVVAGASTSYTVNMTSSGGFSEVVSFSASGLPADVTVSFDPPTLSGTGSSLMTLVTGSMTPVGSYLLTITGSSASLVRTTSVSLTVEPPPTADLVVTKTASPDPVVPGTDVTYTITVSNNGPDAAESVTLTDDIPVETTFLSVTVPLGWACIEPPIGGTGTLTCTVPSLAAGTTEVFTLVVNVNAEVGEGTTISNTATVSASTTDPDPGSNSSTATVTASSSEGLRSHLAANRRGFLPRN